MAEPILHRCAEARDFDGAVYVEDTGVILAGRKGAMPWECRPLRTAQSGNGYLYVHLWRNGKRLSLPVHRLVAQYHVPDFRSDWDVHHRDGHRARSNAADNLVCLPHGRHSAMHGEARPMRHGEALSHSKLTEADVLEMRRLRREAGMTWRALATKFGVSEAAAWKAVTGRTWRHLPN